MSKQNPKVNKSKKLLITLIVVWLLALPAAFFISTTARIATRNYNETTTITSIQSVDGKPVEVSKSHPAVSVANVVSLLLGLYAFFGWIPVTIVGLKDSKK